MRQSEYRYPLRCTVCVLAVAASLAIHAVAAHDSIQGAGSPSGSPLVPPAAAPSPLRGLELVWRIDLPPNRLVGGIASDPGKGVVHALAPANKAGEFKRCLQINADREFTIQSGNIVLRAARLRPEIRSTQSGIEVFRVIRSSD